MEHPTDTFTLLKILKQKISLDSNLYDKALLFELQWIPYNFRQSVFSHKVVVTMVMAVMMMLTKLRRNVNLWCSSLSKCHVKYIMGINIVKDRKGNRLSSFLLIQYTNWHSNSYTSTLNEAGGPWICRDVGIFSWGLYDPLMSIRFSMGPYSEIVNWGSTIVF